MLLGGQAGGAWPPGRSGCGEGLRPFAATRKAGGDLEPHPFSPADAFWRVARLWEGAARSDALSMRAPEANWSSSTPASSES